MYAHGETNQKNLKQTVDQMEVSKSEKHERSEEASEEASEEVSEEALYVEREGHSDDAHHGG